MGRGKSFAPPHFPSTQLQGVRALADCGDCLGGVHVKWDEHRGDTM